MLLGGGNHVGLTEGDGSKTGRGESGNLRFVWAVWASLVAVWEPYERKVYSVPDSQANACLYSTPNNTMNVIVSYAGKIALEM